MKISGYITEKIRKHIRNKLFVKLLSLTFTTMIIPVIFLGIWWFSKNPNVKILFFPDIFLFLVLALCLAFVVSYYLSRVITTPISIMTKSAIEIGRGNFSHQIKIYSDDELGRLARLFNYMTTELRRLNNMNLAQIIAERNKTQTIIRNIADGVIVTDPKSRILILNSCAENWFEINEKQVYSKPLSQIIKEPKLLQLTAEATSRKHSILPSIEISIKPENDWREKTLQARAARVQQEDGELIGIVTILRDITQQKEIDKMKTELVSMVAHELRSPLTSISGFSELLLDKDIPRDQAEEYANIILKESNRLSELINKFLDISRIESGRIQPQKSDLDMGEIVQMVVGSNSYLANKKNMQVEVHIPSEPCRVWADSGMMEQVILNLFSNAVKYSPENTRIDIVVTPSEDQIAVKIKDQGYGIPQHAVKKIFEKFYRVSSSNDPQRTAKGSGLGLALVKQIVDMHNGHIDIESVVDKGSVFTIYLPEIRSSERRKMNQKEQSHDIIQ
jgi:PAS domain S-box-containing protein